MADAGTSVPADPAQELRRVKRSFDAFLSKGKKFKDAFDVKGVELYYKNLVQNTELELQQLGNDSDAVAHNKRVHLQATLQDAKSKLGSVFPVEFFSVGLMPDGNVQVSGTSAFTDDPSIHAAVDILLKAVHHKERARMLQADILGVSSMLPAVQEMGRGLTDVTFIPLGQAASRTPALPPSKGARNALRAFWKAKVAPTLKEEGLPAACLCKDVKQCSEQECGSRPGCAAARAALQWPPTVPLVNLTTIQLHTQGCAAIYQWYTEEGKPGFAKGWSEYLKSVMPDNCKKAWKIEVPTPVGPSQADAGFSTAA